jgi:hypothetical protein
LRTATTTLTAVFASTLVSAAAFASDVTDGAGAAKGSLNSPSVNSIIGTVTNTLIFFVGAISVIVLIIGGLRYVISGGNSASVQGAKNTILYAIVGLVVSIAAYAIVQFVFSVLHVT